MTDNFFKTRGIEIKKNDRLDEIVKAESEEKWKSMTS